MEGVAEPAVADKAWYAKPRVWLVVGLVGTLARVLFCLSSSVSHHVQFLLAALAILIPLAVLYGRAGTLVNAVSTACLFRLFSPSHRRR